MWRAWCGTLSWTGTIGLLALVLFGPGPAVLEAGPAADSEEAFISEAERGRLPRAPASEVSPLRPAAYRQPLPADPGAPVENAELTAALRRLHAKYAASGRTREAAAAQLLLQDLTAPPAGLVAPDPGNLTEYAGQVGKQFLFSVVGSTQGFVWGSGPYSSDSSLAAAAVHAGVVEPNQSGLVLVTLAGPQDAFQGTIRHGVTTRSYGAWAGSYRVESVCSLCPPPAERSPIMSPATEDIPAGPEKFR